MKRPRQKAELMFVAKRGLSFAVIVLLSAGLVVEAASAEIDTCVGTTRDTFTISTQAHPKKIEMALLIMEKQTTDGLFVGYRLDRWNWGPVALGDGGRMIGTLRLITESGTRTIARSKTECQADIWQDERGSFNQRACDFTFLGNGLLDLEPGDVLAWTLKFKKMPELEFEAFEDTVYRDRFEIVGVICPVSDDTATEGARATGHGGARRRSLARESWPCDHLRGGTR